ncbi:hypothetical protein PSACC_01338 [Paramicrosporidium saccamoebae]|uniref:Uncharacterized protein n=1 Tax=Paramicrosporidium saccamoebae TaxID=1246581 RepID=A0A2H9TM45_9FUNG|nr:hypothetical protein PSACC_01338 [Paramicrosporidium saccamoebae]
MPSIFITASGEMKLGGFEMASSIKDDETLICDYGGVFRDINFRDWPSEITSPSGCLPWRQLRALPPYSIDSYMLGKLLSEIFQGVSRIPTEISSFIQRSTTSDHHQRPNPAELINGGALFRGVKVIEIADKMESLSVMDHEQRERFLTNISSNANQLPGDFVSYKVIPSLVGMFQISSARESIAGIRLLFSCAARLSPKETSTMIVPVLVVLLSKPDRAVRMALLESVPTVLDRLDSRAIQEKIYPQVISGFTDALPALREQTLKTSLLLAPKLTSRQLNGELLRFYARLQGDEQAGIRVNTTVCLGRIAKLLDESTRAKVLGAAFVKSLRDPFVPSRSAGLAAISATADLLPVEEIARNVLPNTIPLIIDTDSDVRRAALKAATQLITKLGSHAATMPVVVAVSPAEPTSAQSIASKSPPSDSSWGISSLADKLIGTDLSDDPKAKSYEPTHTTRRASETGNRAKAPVRSIQRKAPMVAVPIVTKETDGWGADEDLIQDLDSGCAPAVCTSPLFEDDDNPWSLSTSTNSGMCMSGDSGTRVLGDFEAQNTYIDPRTDGPASHSSLVRTKVSTPLKKDLKPMVLGKTKTKLSDHF